MTINVKPYSPEWRRLSEEERASISSATAPVKLGPIATALGIKVSIAFLDPSISGEIRRKSGAGHSGFAITINKFESKPRQRFTLAHEIAHYLLHRNIIKECLEDNVLYRSTLSNAREAEANRLASDIILPPNLVHEKLVELGDKPNSVLALALGEFFQVSDAAIKIRLGLK